ncbi:DNA polymerase III subunit alpha [Sphingobacterium multivorum]|uniref:DNA polymerase III subunit alpha n=1 Tax=Sphingobacterium multivorum TaxID=28454 RepID=A0A2X2JSL8_SPHMU|nr:PHP domain-containing protein [Sphingobacterium multivorum]SPZ95086.1 DNA polymerase III subunit alpha [Sphingobacterium multivorum]
MRLVGLLDSIFHGSICRYVLNCHSFHSLRYGTLSIDDLIYQALALGIKELVLTDINTVTGVYEFKKKCEENNIRPIVGVEVRNGSELYYIAIAKEFSGLAEVNKMLTSYNCDNIELPLQPELIHNFIIYPLSNIPKNLGENEYVGIYEDELNLLIRSEYKKLFPKMVILCPITFSTKKEYNLHRILRAIDNNTLLSKLAEKEVCRKSEYFRSVDSVCKIYRHYPEIIENTQKLLSQCSFEFAFSTPRNRKHYTGTKADDLKLLTRLAYAGLERRYGRNHEIATKRIEKELKVIDELNFSGYFLITWDIIRYSNSMGFMHVGRGSGANSIVAYCLGITDICPIELDLYFERFLNLNRKSPPDFDIDGAGRKEILYSIIYSIGMGKNMSHFVGRMLNSNISRLSGR